MYSLLAQIGNDWNNWAHPSDCRYTSLYTVCHTVSIQVGLDLSSLQYYYLYFISQQYAREIPAVTID